MTTKKTDLLTKEILMAGKNATIEIEILEPQGTVIIRPLTASEINLVELKKIEGSGKQTISYDQARAGMINLDLYDTTKKSFASDVMAVSMALVDPKLSEGDVKNLPQMAFKQIVSEIYRVSGVTKLSQDNIATFREEPGRS
ncbi:MAG: hypothetical protein WC262_07045 [Bacteroidales bacterium]|jgi:hypothetical protein